MEYWWHITQCFKQLFCNLITFAMDLFFSSTSSEYISKLYSWRLIAHPCPILPQSATFNMVQYQKLHTVKHLYSDTPIFRHPYIPTTQLMFRHSYIPTPLYSVTPTCIFRQLNLYSDITIFRHPCIPSPLYSVTPTCMFRQLNLYSDIPIFQHPCIPSPLHVCSDN